MKDEDGRSRRLTREDLDDILERAARQADGSYRVLASRNIAGRPLGPFRYYGTRPDDPNDIFPHEHRRELRGLSVFAAWLNHDEVRSSNSHDSVVAAGSRQIVRHHLLDFGSTLGSGSIKAQSRRAGNEFVWESRPTLITMLTLGLYVRPWIKVPYPDIPAVGRIESTYYRAESWKPDYPNPAFRNARPDDRFWAARIVAAFTDEAVAAVVRSAKFTDPGATAVPDQDSARATDQGAQRLAERHQPRRRPGAQRGGRADVRERGDARRRGQAGRAIHGTVVAIRQRRRDGSPGRRRTDPPGAEGHGAGGAAVGEAGIHLR